MSTTAQGPRKLQLLVCIVYYERTSARNLIPQLLVLFLTHSSMRTHNSLCFYLLAPPPPQPRISGTLDGHDPKVWERQKRGQARFVTMISTIPILCCFHCSHVQTSPWHLYFLGKVNSGQSLSISQISYCKFVAMEFNTRAVEWQFL
jgi:hypothetical protein